MKVSRLRVAAVAAAVALVMAAGAVEYARRVEARAVHPLAAQMFPQKTRGTALQLAAFRQSDLLPVYGSSELNVPNPYHASALFRAYPQGFTVFPVGDAGSTSLIWLQALAAVGTGLHGKKVALCVSPRSFLTPMADRHAYAGNFSPLHAYETVFSARLGFAVKQAVARRMLQYPATFADDRLLAFALDRLADGSALSRMLYYASWPLGRLHAVALRLGDHWETLTFVQAQQGLHSLPRQAAGLHWPTLLRQAEGDAARAAGRNPFGFEGRFWSTHAAEIARQKGAYASSGDHGVFAASAEWADLDLLLGLIRQLGGQPLLLSAPMNATYYEYLGIPQPARQAFYERLRALAVRHRVTVTDFADHENDTHFTVDPAAHLSSKGWVYYNRALDAFFRDGSGDDA